MNILDYINAIHPKLKFSTEQTDSEQDELS